MTQASSRVHSAGRHGSAFGLLLACALAGALAWPGDSRAQETGKRLSEVEQALEASESRSQTLRRKAAELQQEIAGLQNKSIEAAEKTQNLESQLTRIETMLQDLKVKYEAKTAELQSQRTKLYHTLAALQRIAIQPTEAVLISRGTPVERLRSALLLRAAVPAIEDQAASIRGDLEELASLRLAIEQQHLELSATARALAEERRLLSDLIGRKKDLYAQTLGERESAESNAQHLATEASNLRELIARLEEQSRLRAAQEARARVAEHARLQAELMAQGKQNDSQPDSAAPGPNEYDGTKSLATGLDTGEDTAQSDGPALAALTLGALERPDNVRPFPPGGAIPLLIMPVRGQLVVFFGQQPTGAESVSKGISIATRAQAQVVAPYDGQIVYAGEFRGYGQILIIEHGGRYHTLLAGLERIDAVVGQWILAGEPIGIMGSPQERSPELYLELRHAGQPVNPLPWLATTNNKVQG
jgi:murein hydrolase activator